MGDWTKITRTVAREIKLDDVRSVAVGLDEDGRTVLGFVSPSGHALRFSISPDARKALVRLLTDTAPLVVGHEVVWEPSTEQRWTFIMHIDEHKDTPDKLIEEKPDATR